MPLKESPTILCIETSTEICSVAVIKEGQIASLVESYIRYRHGEWLTIAIDDAMNAALCDKRELDAISITLGPGSYTGLRIGLATAKAMCSALDIPLIGHSSLEVLAYGISDSLPGEEYIMPMIDARRMEVYTAIFDSSLHRLTEDSPRILDEDYCSELQAQYPRIYIGGDGAAKSLELWPDKRNIRFPVDNISAKYQLWSALMRYSLQEFQDIAYVAPIYLKNPNITVPKRTL